MHERTAQPLHRHPPLADTIISVVTITAPGPAHNRSQCPMRQDIMGVTARGAVARIWMFRPLRAAKHRRPSTHTRTRALFIEGIGIVDQDGVCVCLFRVRKASGKLVT